MDAAAATEITRLVTKLTWPTVRIRFEPTGHCGDHEVWASCSECGSEFKGIQTDGTYGPAIILCWVSLSDSAAQPELVAAQTIARRVNMVPCRCGRFHRAAS